MANRMNKDLRILCDYLGLEPDDFTYEYGNYFVKNRGDHYFVLNSERELRDEVIEREYDTTYRDYFDYSTHEQRGFKEWLNFMTQTESIDAFNTVLRNSEILENAIFESTVDFYADIPYDYKTVSDIASKLFEKYKNRPFDFFVDYEVSPKPFITDEVLKQIVTKVINSYPIEDMKYYFNDVDYVTGYDGKTYIIVDNP